MKGYGQCSNLAQDIAAITSLTSLAEEFLSDFGYRNILITTAFHQWMGDFPENETQVSGFISWGAVAGSLGKVNKIISKSPHEALGVPTKEANISGIKITKQIVNMLKDQEFFSREMLEEEIRIIKEETRGILKKVIELGDQDIAIGTILAFKEGFIDIPFASNRFNLGKILPVRDNNGAVRLLSFGNLPLTKEIIDFHKLKIEERVKRENRQPSLQMVIDDIYAIGKGMLVGRPRSGESYN